MCHQRSGEEEEQQRRRIGGHIRLYKVPKQKHSINKESTYVDVARYRHLVGKLDTNVW